MDWNPSFVLKDDPAGANLSRIERASRFIFLSTKLHLQIQDGSFPPDFEGKAPLHMLQHAKLFGTSRIPHFGRDSMPTFANSKHICILSNGHIYSIPVVDADGVTITSVKKLMGQLAFIEKNSQRIGKGADLGALTALPRDQWAGVRLGLMHNKDSKKLLNEVDRSLFVVSLDGIEPSDPNDCAKQMLVGSKSDRWFDKWEFILTPSGIAGFNLEHSPYDGHAFVSMFNNMWPYLENLPLERFDGKFLEEHVTHLNVSISSDVKKAIGEGRAYLNEKDNSLSLAILEKEYGTDVIKNSLKSSPG